MTDTDLTATRTTGTALDALVVGAGPVGLMLACELRRHGVSCRIVDRAPARTDESKAVVVHARTIEHLDHLGLAQEFIDRGALVHGVSFFHGAVARRRVAVAGRRGRAGGRARRTGT
jgi:2-polyprenyl-6-methoxyphenol hydroxylase-like FAD-dependent oxidoreductase